LILPTKVDFVAIAIVLAHMDDEAFLSPYLISIAKQNVPVDVYFLTKSEGRNQKFDQTVREQESLKFFRKILPQANLHFLGRELNVLDLEAHLKIEELIEKLKNMMHSDTKLILTTNYEGGHIDHDTTCFIAYKLSKIKDSKFATFNLYRAKYFKYPFYKVIDEISQEHQFEKIPLKPKDFIKIIQIPIIYKSQWRTWFGIFPFLILKFLKSNGVFIEFPSELNFLEPPNSGAVLYINRGDGDFESWAKKITEI